MPGQFDIPAGARLCVLRIFSSSLPGEARFRAEMADGGPVAGEVEVTRRRWLSARAERRPLSALNRVEKSWADADFRIHVTPARACRVTFETRHLRAGLMLRLIVAVAALGLVAALAVPMIAGR